MFQGDLIARIEGSLGLEKKELENQGDESLVGCSLWERVMAMKELHVLDLQTSSSHI